MPLQAAQIVSLAVGIAKARGYTAQAGEMLNAILSDLCQTYDFQAAKTSTNIEIGTQVGSGPYQLPADYLRAAKGKAIYMVDGVPYDMINIDLDEFDDLVQQAGISTYPYNWTSDPSTTPASMYVWPPPGGNFLPLIRYYRQMPDIQMPETSTVIPWFPNDAYLIKRLSANLMMITDDERSSKFDMDAEMILGKFLKLQNDDEGRAQTVSLDRRRFGRAFNRLPNTKIIGW